MRHDYLIDSASPVQLDDTDGRENVFHLWFEIHFSTVFLKFVSVTESPISVRLKPTRQNRQDRIQDVQ